MQYVRLSRALKWLLRSWFVFYGNISMDISNCYNKFIYKIDISNWYNKLIYQMEKCQRTAQENLPSNAKLRLMSNLSQVVFSTAKKTWFWEKKKRTLWTHTVNGQYSNQASSTYLFQFIDNSDTMGKRGVGVLVNL